MKTRKVRRWTGTFTIIMQEYATMHRPGLRSVVDQACRESLYAWKGQWKEGQRFRYAVTPLKPRRKGRSR